MAYYDLSEILNCLQDYSKQGIKYVEISELEAIDADTTASLLINGINDDNDIEEFIDSIDIPS